MCNSAESSGVARKGSLICSACGNKGHQSNNQACPKYSETHTDGSTRKRIADQTCGSCGGKGHTKRSRKCPNYGQKEEED